MKIYRSLDPETNGALAALKGAEAIRAALEAASTVHIIVATGASQFEVLGNLLKEPEIAWERVSIFHLDEYVGLPISHPASFRQYLWDRFVKLLPHPPRAFHPLNGETDPEAECQRVGAILSAVTIDVAFIGIGENGHIAFNDPPADFEATQPYHVVKLDEACRQQQWGEGWFSSQEEIPSHAISMTVPEILRSRKIICTVPDERKAEAVKNAVEGPVSNLVPASVLQEHPDVSLFLDDASARQLS